jgi:hypothetical protein
VPLIVNQTGHLLDDNVPRQRVIVAYARTDGKLVVLVLAYLVETQVCVLLVLTEHGWGASETTGGAS